MTGSESAPESRDGSADARPPGDASPAADADVRVPPGATAHECPYCGRPFPRARARTLHVGLDHPERADDEEIEAFQAAYREERDGLRRFQLVALATLVALYFGFLFAYAAFA